MKVITGIMLLIMMINTISVVEGRKNNKCGPRTAPDEEGPYYRDDDSLNYRTAPPSELANPEVSAVITGKVSFY